MWDSFLPEWTCPHLELMPANLFLDGHKWMCALGNHPNAVCDGAAPTERANKPERAAKKGCLIYSFGSHGDDR